MGFVSPDSSVTISEPAKQDFKLEREEPPELNFAAVAAEVLER
jgi:hypothetical protein